MKQKFAEKLKELREANRYTQSQIATSLGVTTRQVQRYEENVIPRPDKIRSLNKIFNYDFFPLLNDVESRDDNDDEEMSVPNWYQDKIDHLLRINEKHADNYGKLSDAYLKIADRISSGMSGEASGPSGKKDKSSKRRGIGELQDKQEIHSAGFHHQQKDSVKG